MTAAALLVIDIQRGAFDGARCPTIDRSTDLVNNARALVDAARASGTPIVFIQHCDEPGQPFEEGTPHWEFHEDLSPLPEDTVIRKYSSSAFENTDLAAKLERLGTREVVLCGLQSEFCVSNTARSALELGYGVRVAKDGHSTWPSDGKSSSLISEEVNGQLEERGAVVESTTSLAASLGTRA
jgi:nicotinamidase-related amidase